MHPGSATTTASHHDPLLPDIIASAILTAKAGGEIGQYTPVPFIGAVLSSVAGLLEVIQKAEQNDADIARLFASVKKIQTLLAGEIYNHALVHNEWLKKQCDGFTKDVTVIVDEIEALYKKNNKRRIITKYFRHSSVSDKILEFEKELSDLRANITMVSSTGNRLDLQEIKHVIDQTHRSVVTAGRGISALQLRSSSPEGTFEYFQSKVNLEHMGATVSRTYDTAARLDERLNELQSHASQMCAKIDGIAPRISENGLYSVALGDVRLTREVRRANVYSETRQLGSIVDYTAIVGNAGSLRIVRSYEGSAQERLEVELGMFKSIRHPNVLQLFGTVESSSFRGLVFHNTRRTTLESQGETFIDQLKYMFRARNDFQSALQYLHEKHRLVSFLDWSTPVDEDGNIILDQMFSSPEPSTSRAVNWHRYTNTFPRQQVSLVSLDDVDPQDFDRISRDRITYFHNILLGLFAATFTRGVVQDIKFGTVKINEPRPPHMSYHIASAPLKPGRLFWGRDEFPKDNDSRTGGLPPPFTANTMHDGSKRFTISVNEVPSHVSVGGRCIAELSLGMKKRLWHTLLSQLNRVINIHRFRPAVPFRIDIGVAYDIKIERRWDPLDIRGTFMAEAAPGPTDVVYLFLAPVQYGSDGVGPVKYFFSSDALGNEIISVEDLHKSFGLSIQVVSHPICAFIAGSVAWRSRLPDMLQQIHERCGFKYDGTEVAEYLGLPILDIHLPDPTSKVYASWSYQRSSLDVIDDVDESTPTVVETSDSVLSSDDADTEKELLSPHSKPKAILAVVDIDDGDESHPHLTKHLSRMILVLAISIVFPIFLAIFWML